MPKKMPIFYNALLLTAVNLLLRMVGTSFQVYLSSRIGASGVGLLQLVMSVGAMTMVAGMAGVRTAAMYLTAEESGRKKQENVTRILSGCLLYSVLCSTAVGAMVFHFAPLLADRWIGQPDTVDSLRMLAAFLPVNCLCGVMVGYFTGANRIGMLALVEVAEQVCTMASTVALLALWAGNNAQRACMCVVMGSALGGCLTLTCLVILRLRERAVPGPKIPVARRLADIAVPLALADDLRTGISTAENLMVPKRLALYPMAASPLAAYGTVCGMVFPVLMFPAAILFGLTELLIPELARCRAAGSSLRIRYLVKKSLRIALLYGAACAGGMFLAAESLCMKLYHNADAGRYLRWFAPLAVMLYCDSVTDAMVKGLGQQKASVRYNIITSAMDVALLYVLLPKYGIGGYFFSFLVTHAINFSLSLRRLLKISGVHVSPAVPMLTVSAGLGAVWACSHASGPVFQVGAYLTMLVCLLFLFKILSRNDITWLAGMIRNRKNSSG